jgi:hypothetical protein
VPGLPKVKAKESTTHTGLSFRSSTSFLAGRQKKQKKFYFPEQSNTIVVAFIFVLWYKERNFIPAAF